MCIRDRCPEGKRHAGMYRFPQREDDHTLSLPHVLKQTHSVTRYKDVYKRQRRD